MIFESMFELIGSKHPPLKPVKSTVKRRKRLLYALDTGGASGAEQVPLTARETGARYSHSMVPGGLLVMSSTTRLTSATSLVIRVEIRSSTS
jgi:membrane-bound lytic murein transglycosylase